MRPYSSALSIISLEVFTELIAANPWAIGLIVKKKTSPKTSPEIKVTYVINEKVLFALSILFSPKYLETNAAPPAPNIKPTQATIMMIGKIRLTPAKALLEA